MGYVTARFPPPPPPPAAGCGITPPSPHPADGVQLRGEQEFLKRLFAKPEAPITRKTRYNAFCPGPSPGAGPGPEPGPRPGIGFGPAPRAKYVITQFLHYWSFWEGCRGKKRLSRRLEWRIIGVLSSGTRRCSSLLRTPHLAPEGPRSEHHILSPSPIGVWGAYSAHPTGKSDSIRLCVRACMRVRQIQRC